MVDLARFFRVGGLAGEMAVTTARKRIAVLAMVLVASLASPAMADSPPSTRLVRCATGNCLLVSGRRDSVASAVLINGHAVTVEGGRSWRTRLSVETVRDWSAPYARSIEVTLQDRGTRQTASEDAELPIGLLGHVTDLASLVVAVR